MLIGAEMTLQAGFGTARPGLAALAGNGWLMAVPRGFGALDRGSAADDQALVMVVFGGLMSGPSLVLLPVRWEPVAPGSGFPDLLDGGISLVPGPGPGARLGLSGACQLPPGTVPARRGPAQLQAVEVVRGFMTRVAATVDGPAARAAGGTGGAPASPPPDGGPPASSRLPDATGF